MGAMSALVFHRHPGLTAGSGQLRSRYQAQQRWVPMLPELECLCMVVVMAWKKVLKFLKRELLWMLVLLACWLASLLPASAADDWSKQGNGKSNCTQLERYRRIWS